MLKESFEHAKDDMHAKQLAEQQVSAKRVLEALRSALEKDADELLSAQEQQAIGQARAELEDACEGGDSEQIKQAIAKLEHASETFVERRMNRSVRQVMRGHRVEEFEQD